MFKAFNFGFIAVLLILIAFFLVNSGSNVNVIEVSNSRHFDRCYHCTETELFIQVDANGEMEFSGHSLSKEELIDALASHPEFQTKRMLSIVSDSNSSFSIVVELTDYIKLYFPDTEIGWSVSKPSELSS